ncbi:MAG: hypothetical protein ABIJ05_02055 [Patescibacteria group bacterium]
MKENLLDLYSDYLISQNQYATATGLSAILDKRISHDKITRFLNFRNFGSKDLWSFIKPEIRLIEENPYTDENEVIAWPFSHAVRHEAFNY